MLKYNGFSFNNNFSKVVVPSRFFSSKSGFHKFISIKLCKIRKRKVFLRKVKKTLLVLKKKFKKSRKHNIKKKKILAKLRVIYRTYNMFFPNYFLLAPKVKHWVRNTFFPKHNKLKTIFFLYDKKKKRKVDMKLHEHRRQIWFYNQINYKRLSRYRPFYRNALKNVVYQTFFRNPRVSRKNYKLGFRYNTNDNFLFPIFTSIGKNILPVLPSYKKTFFILQKSVLTDTYSMKYLK